MKRIGVVALAAVAAVSSVSLISDAAPFKSVELAYTDKSPSGLEIVPASCPSTPHNGEVCSTGTGSGTGSGGLSGTSGGTGSGSGSGGGGTYYPPPAGNISVNPIFVRRNDPTRVIWNAANVSTCTISEDNPSINNTWTGSGAGCGGGTCTSGTSGAASLSIDRQTVYTLACTGQDGSTMPPETATVYILPTWSEQ